MRNRPLYAFDAEADAMQRWHEVSSVVEMELQTGKITPLFDVGNISATDVVSPAHGIAV